MIGDDIAIVCLADEFGIKSILALNGNNIHKCSIVVGFVSANDWFGYVLSRRALGIDKSELIRRITESF